jgi:hypothetical protein
MEDRRMISQFARASCPIALLLCAALAGTTPAALADEPIQSVKVTGLKAPEMRSYRSIVAGLDAFDRDHALAPAATLRFRMMRQAGGPMLPSDGVVLNLVSDGETIPVPIDADGLLTVQRSQAAYDADATFMLNRKSGMFSAYPEVRTPGLPDNVRRLGDLRLECRVTVAIVKEQMPFLARAAVNTLLMGSQWCTSKEMNFGYPSPMPLAGATLRRGERSMPLQVEEWRYTVPIGDASWPDDALVELRYASPSSSGSAPPSGGR